MSLGFYEKLIHLFYFIQYDTTTTKQQHKQTMSRVLNKYELEVAKMRLQGTPYTYGITTLANMILVFADCITAQQLTTIYNGRSGMLLTVSIKYNNDCIVMMVSLCDVENRNDVSHIVRTFNGLNGVNSPNYYDYPYNTMDYLDSSLVEQLEISDNEVKAEKRKVIEKKIQIYKMEQRNKIRVINLVLYSGGFDANCINEIMSYY